MNRLLNRLTLTALAVLALTTCVTTAKAQGIYTVQGGRTTVTLSKGFLGDLTTLKIVPTALYGSQVYENQVFFPITAGEINLANAEGQILHSGGIFLTSATKEVRLQSFILTTTGEQAYITAIVVANGKLVGRINLFDVELPSTLKLPLDPHSGDVFLSGLKLTLDPAGAAALNDAFGVKTFADSSYIGYALSLGFVPLSADGK